MRLLFTGHFEWNCGSTQVIQSYVRAGAALGIDVLVWPLGPIDRIAARHLPVTDVVRPDDVLILVFESDLYIDDYKQDLVERSVDRKRRIIIDADGKYGRYITCQGDANHNHLEEMSKWTARYDALSDIILQPTLEVDSVSHRFLFFGIDILFNKLQQCSWQQREWELGYIGNNWYRWNDMVWLLNGISSIRCLIKRVGIRGMWWDGRPLTGFEGAQEATYSDPHFLQSHQVDLGLSVPYDGVVNAMSKAIIHPVLVRPILRTMHFITPRMFETFNAGCIPVFPPYLTYTTALYSDEVRALFLQPNPSAKICEIMSELDFYAEVLENIWKHLCAHHTYQIRIKELLQFVV